MKFLFSILLFLILNQIFGQQKQCYCDIDTNMNHATVSCEVIKLKNNSKLYWQFNCDKIWLTLENINGKKTIINKIEAQYYGYTYRLGYHLIKEYKNSLLFRSGCAANGGCTYILIDKVNGKKVKEFKQLICINTDVQYTNPHKYNYDFVVYISNNSNHLFIEYIDRNKILKVPFKFEASQIYPEDQFSNLKLNNNILSIEYTENEIKKKLTVDLNNKKFL